LNPYVPLLFLLAFVAAVAGVLLALDHLLGPKRPSAVKMSPYECGVPPVGNARERFHVRFFVVGLLFILFDVEVVFFYLWVYLFTDPALAHMKAMILAEVFLFLGVLTLGLGYAWGKGALEWE
jgi:NADH-quinone oxidoreductase subunit A